MRNNQLQTIANGVASESLMLKARVARVEANNSEVKKRMINTESKLSDVEKLICERPAKL